MLALQEALERAVDAGRSLLERAEAAAAQAERGEVLTMWHRSAVQQNNNAPVVQTWTSVYIGVMPPSYSGSQFAVDA